MLIADHESAPIWPAIRDLLSLSPIFLYAPCSPGLAAVDYVSGTPGFATRTAICGVGGIVNPIGATSPARVIQFKTQFSILDSELFIAFALIGGVTTNANGSLFSLSDNNFVSVAFAHGAASNNVDGATGTRIGIIRESVDWVAGSAAAWANGLNCVALYRTASNLTAVNTTTNATVNTTTATTFSGELNRVIVNGRSARSSAWPVPLVAVFKGAAMPSATALREVFRKFERTPLSMMASLFEPKTTWFHFAASASYSHPNLTNARGVNSTSSGFQPAVDYNFA